MRIRSVSWSTTAGPGLRAVAVFTLMLAALPTPPAHAAITFYEIFKTEAYSQTSNAQPTTPSGYFGDARVTADNPADLTGGQVTSSSPLSPMTLTESAGLYIYKSPLFSTSAALDADFPNGTQYTFTLTGGNFGGQSATLTTPSSNLYASTVPYLTNNAFTALQGINPGGAINLTWNPYTPSTGVNNPLIFVVITQVSNGQSVYSISGNNTITSTTVPAGTLLPGTQYDLDIVYSDRVYTTNAGFNGATADAAYDVRTDLVFTTGAAVPEPSSWVLLLCGAGISTLATRRRQSRASRASRSA